jgi:hypothetical protein
MGGEMSAAPPALNAVKAAAASAVAWARAQFSKQAHVVGRLVEKGMEIAEGISRQLPDRAEMPPHGRTVDLFSLSGLFEKVSRAVHMAIVLQSRLAAELSKPDSEIAGDLERAQAEPQAEAAVQRQARAGEPAVRLGGGALERGGRIEDACQRAVDRLWRHVMTNPIDQLIAEIGRALGLGRDWLRQVEEEWDREQAARAQPEPNSRERPSYPPSSRALCPGPMNTAVRSDPERPPRPP